jgi:15-cis-phytoene synthase
MMSAKADAQPARALARLYCPPAQRAVFAALLDIEAQLGTGLQRALEHEVAHARLAWWREECARLSAAHPLHPLTRQLQAHFGSRAPAALAGLSGLVDTAAWDLAAATFETRRELDAYCERWSAALVAPLAAAALPAAAPGFGLALGRGLRELELLNSLTTDARHGRIRLPLDELAGCGAQPEELAANSFGMALTELLQRRHREVRTALAGGIAALAPSEQTALPALLVWATIVMLQSQRVGAALPRATCAGDHHAPLDGWRAWRAARRAQAGRLLPPVA